MSDDEDDEKDTANITVESGCAMWAAVFLVIFILLLCCSPCLAGGAWVWMAAWELFERSLTAG